MVVFHRLTEGSGIVLRIETDKFGQTVAVVQWQAHPYTPGTYHRLSHLSLSPFVSHSRPF